MSDAELTATLPHYPFSFRGDVLAPALKQFLVHEPVTRVVTNAGAPAWLVTGYALARDALKDPRLSRSALSDPAMPQEDSGAPPFAVVGTMILLRRAGLRDEAVRGMSPRQQYVPLPRVRGIAEELLVAMAGRGSSGDLVEDFALPWAARVTCELLGLRPAVASEVSTWFGLMATGPLADRLLPTEWPASLSRLETWMDDLAETGLLPRLKQLNEASPHPLLPSEMLELGHMLTFSGLANPAAFLAACGLALARDPGLANRLREQPDLVPRMVEEVYRWAPLLGDSITRIAMEDLVIGGVQVRAGELVMISTDAANHDPAVFAEPERLDIDRDAAPHLRFGQGRHYCPAAALNQLQTEAALHVLLARLPNLRLAAEPPVTWRDHHSVLMPVAVPVHW
ncbi:cytochrome P450 [Streptomyces flavidovirens]|uniref:cytochrome P450 n=1 Tax=Streptomyces flavidovirens TaxID=67298 RepID=UPI0034445EC3